MIASITGIFSFSLFIPLDCILDTRDFPSCVPQSRCGYLSYPRGGWSSCSSFQLLNKYTMSHFKGKLSQFVMSIDSRGIFLNRSFHILLISMLCLDSCRSPGYMLLAWTTCSGLNRCYFCFFLEKEDNNPCIAFLKARLTCHQRGETQHTNKQCWIIHYV